MSEDLSLLPGTENQTTSRSKPASAEAAGAENLGQPGACKTTLRAPVLISPGTPGDAAEPAGRKATGNGSPNSTRGADSRRGRNDTAGTVEPTAAHVVAAGETAKAITVPRPEAAQSVQVTEPTSGTAKATLARHRLGADEILVRMNRWEAEWLAGFLRDEEPSLAERAQGGKTRVADTDALGYLRSIATGVESELEELPKEPKADYERYPV